jgi:hypothetical protein
MIFRYSMHFRALFIVAWSPRVRAQGGLAPASPLKASTESTTPIDKQGGIKAATVGASGWGSKRLMS